MHQETIVGYSLSVIFEQFARSLLENIFVHICTYMHRLRVRGLTMDLITSGSVSERSFALYSSSGQCSSEFISDSVQLPLDQMVHRGQGERGLSVHF